MPVEYIARRSSLIAGPQMLHRPQLLHQLAERFCSVGNRSQAAYFTIRLCYRHCNRLGMDIQAQKSYLFLHDRFLSACGSALCFFPESQPNPRSAHWTGHSMMTSESILHTREPAKNMAFISSLCHKDLLGIGRRMMSGMTALHASIE